MILTSTYHGRTTLSRDLLAAFSALDHATTAALPPDQLTGAFERLLQRLAVLTTLHGPQAPRRFLRALAEATDEVDVVEVAASFLEHGEIGRVQDASEIQQEIVHFSRIVDVGQLGLTEAVAEHALRRLRGSDRLPDSLKVLSELLVVTRSRLAQRGRILPRPRLRPVPPTEADVGPCTTVASPATDPDYWIAARCPRRRVRRQCRYELAALLAYLTPVEAALALWAHLHEQQLPVPVDLAVVQADIQDGVTAVTWSYQPTGGSGEIDVLERVAEQLPSIFPIASSTRIPLRVGEDLYHVEAGKNAWAVITDAGADREAATIAAASKRDISPASLAEQAARLFATHTGPELASIECGHIHLDRDLDADQDTGVAIGARLLRMLSARQTRPPVLTPMMDDDHVLVRLTPRRYREFLTDTFGDRRMHLICESSPIIRSIVVTLYQRMTTSGLGHTFQRRGASLFLPMGDGTHCELFEDIDGQNPITGCVFFETALLIYRTNPAGFDDYFTRRFGLTHGVHESAADILSAGHDHDRTVADLAAFYHQFAEVTDPRRPDPDVTAQVRAVLAAAEPVTAHLNVLEDYYEVQQHKVRNLLRLLNLPLTLATVHFNLATGRVVLDG